MNALVTRVRSSGAVLDAGLSHQKHDAGYHQASEDDQGDFKRKKACIDGLSRFGIDDVLSG